jgi:ABC-type amino acid transport substrate-binding protein
MRTARTVALAVSFAALSSTAHAAPPKPVLVVGTEGVYAPFTFTDEKGTLTGYDVEVVQELGKRIGVEVEFLPTPWDSIFLGLEAKRFDLVANQIARNPERERKYLFSDAYLVSGAQVIVRGDRAAPITGLASLGGLRVGTGVGSNYSKLLEDYNARGAKPAIDIKYYDGNLATVLQDVVAGRLDATVNDRLTVGYNVKQLKLAVKLVGGPLALVPSHFVVRKDAEGQALLAKVNAALAELKTDGTLARLSQKWFGEDFTR